VCSSAATLEWVRWDFTGVGTCTHLNDTLRSLEDVTVLMNVLRERVG
jgi:Protein of unknown function (DUF2889)